jgi:hypothetical protein
MTMSKSRLFRATEKSQYLYEHAEILDKSSLLRSTALFSLVVMFTVAPVAMGSDDVQLEYRHSRNRLAPYIRANTDDLLEELADLGIFERVLS